MLGGKQEQQTDCSAGALIKYFLKVTNRTFKRENGKLREREIIIFLIVFGYIVDISPFYTFFLPFSYIAFPHLCIICAKMENNFLLERDGVLKMGNETHWCDVHVHLKFNVSNSNFLSGWNDPLYPVPQLCFWSLWPVTSIQSRQFPREDQ